MGTLVVIRPGFLDVNLVTFAALGTGFLYGIYLIVQENFILQIVHY